MKAEKETTCHPFRRTTTLLSLLFLVLLSNVVLSETTTESQPEADTTNNDNTEKKEPVRMITKEELALHDGNHTETLWLSIMSKVYDVTKGPEYYGPGGPYSIFVGRDGNVPFITGAFNPEEAEKPLTELTPHNLMNLETWVDFYEKEEKYPFVGHLIGDLYEESGATTEMYQTVQEMIAQAKVEAEAQKQKRAELLAKRRREDAERKKKKAESIGDSQQQQQTTEKEANPKTTSDKGEEL